MALNSVTSGSVANSSDINQYKEALEGTRDFTPLMKAASGTDFYVRMSNTGGSRFFKVQNSSAVDALVVNSAGVVTPTTLQITNEASPSDVTAGRISYNSTKNVLVYGNASQVVEIADGASTNLALLGAEQTINNTTKILIGFLIKKGPGIFADPKYSTQPMRTKGSRPGSYFRANVSSKPLNLQRGSQIPTTRKPAVLPKLIGDLDIGLKLGLVGIIARIDAHIPPLGGFVFRPYQNPIIGGGAIHPVLG